jgi:uncharacterized iron-regulated protein
VCTRAAIVAGLLAAVGCSGSALLVPKAGFTLTHGREHALAGRVYSSREHGFVSVGQLHSALRAAPYALLGETHDNPDHHRLQAELLEVFLDAHAGAKLGFEMLDEGDAAVLARGTASTPEAFAKQVAWDESGWPEFRLYRPIFAVALPRHATLIAAHPSPEHVRASMHELPPDEAQALHLDVPLPAEQIAAEREEIREGHCGHGNDAMLTAMQRAQVYKDAFMARALVRAGGAAALIAGRSHVRNDRAVPYFLHRFQLAAAVSVAFVEVDDEHAAPTDYDTSAFDFVVFTPRVDAEDPCIKMKEMFEHKPKAAPPPEPAGENSATLHVRRFAVQWRHG